MMKMIKQDIKQILKNSQLPDNLHPSTTLHYRQVRKWLNEI